MQLSRNMPFKGTYSFLLNYAKKKKLIFKFSHTVLDTLNRNYPKSNVKEYLRIYIKV